MTDAWDAADPGTDQQTGAPVDAWDAAAPTGPTAAPKKNAGALANLGMGAVSGAAKIGATLLYPFQKAVLADARQTDPRVTQTEPTTRADLASFFGEHADPSTLPFRAGELSAEVAGTAGAGGVLGRSALALGAAPEVGAALTTGGMSLGGGTTGSTLGNVALRTGAGAAVGGTSAGLVDPSTAGTGAAIGAATPGAAWLLGMMGKGAGYAAGRGASAVLGATTGTGSAAVDAAYRAGATGDRSFIDNMRGNVSFSDIVDNAKDALAAMRDARGAAYRQGMASVSADKTVLDMTPITDAVKDAQGKFGTYHGQVVNENANAAMRRVSDKVNEWAGLDPTTFHTPEGLDKLKQWIGGELENAKPGTQTDAALKGVYNAVKSSIAKQAPDYANTMQAYEEASDQLREISRTLSLNPTASVDTAVRKLQSILRNNVTTNFGNRAEAVTALENAGANLRGSLAGQSMSSPWPRGITGAVDAAAAIPAAIAKPALLAAAPFTSPRLVGEAAYGLGRLSSIIPSVSSAPLSKVAPLVGTQKPMSLQDLRDLQAEYQRRKAERNPVATP